MSSLNVLDASRIKARGAGPIPAIPDQEHTVSPAVHLDAVTMIFADSRGHTHVALDDFSLRIEEGEFVALVGKSGCGKTTALNLMAGVLTPDYGEVRILDGSPDTRRDELGFMLARDALLPWRTALHNVEYGLEIRGVPRHERRERALRYLEMLGLDHAKARWPWQLSQGMRQRVALARTWALQPRLLLMDEPFAALDAQTRTQAQSDFIDLWSGDADKGMRRTVVFVTHDLTEAVCLADRVVLMSGGQVTVDAAVPFPRPRDPQTLASEPAFQELLERLRGTL